MSESRDLLFLKVAVKNQLLTPDQAEQVLAAIEQRAQLGVTRSASEMAVEKRFIVAAQAEQIESALRTSLPPEQIAGFQIVDKVGSGAVGTVYRARQLSLDKIVALKILHQSLSRKPEFVESFVREAHLVAKLNHPHIVHAIDAGSQDGYHYFAMEFVEGETLKDRLQSRGKLTRDEAVSMCRAICQALAYAHERALLHRDLKPDNILLGTEGQIKLADLGLAMPLDDAQVLAAEHQRMGTPFYLSPEGVQGKGIDARSDLYSLGATLYHAVTGKPPFGGQSVKEILTKHVHQEPVPPGEAGASLDAPFEDLLLQMLAKDPAQRPQTAREVLNRLSLLPVTPTAGPGRPPPRSRRPSAVASAGPGQGRAANTPTTTPSRTVTRKRMGLFTTVGAVVGSCLAALFLVLAISRSASDADATLEGKNEQLAALFAEHDATAVEARRKAWRKRIDDDEQRVRERMGEIVAVGRDARLRERGLLDLLEKNATSVAALEVNAKIDEVRGSIRESQDQGVQEYFDRAQQLRGEGRLWAAYKIIDEVPRALQKTDEIKRRIDELISDLSTEIDGRWAADTQRIEQLRKDKEFRRALSVLDEAEGYADPTTAVDIQRFRDEIQEQLTVYEETQRQQLLQEEMRRYRTLAGQYGGCALSRDFKDCVSKAVTLQTELVSESVRELVLVDLQAFELLATFFRDALRNMKKKGDEGKEVQLRLKDRRRIRGIAKRIEQNTIWVEVAEGGGKAEIPIDATDIIDETLFANVEELYGPEAAPYLVPLGVLFTYRGMYDVAQRHFDLAIAGGTSPDAWIAKLKWLQEHLGGS